MPFYRNAVLLVQQTRRVKGTARRLDGATLHNTTSSPPNPDDTYRRDVSYDLHEGKDSVEHSWEGVGVQKVHLTDVHQTALEEAMGDITDALDTLESDPGHARWDAMYSDVSSLLDTFLLQHAEVRARLPEEALQGFDYWYRPRVREVYNWFQVVVAKRRGYVGSGSEGGGEGGDAIELVSNPSIGVSTNLPPPLSAAELSVLERRVEEGGGNEGVTNLDMYRVWRARGRPAQFAEGGGGGGVADVLPGYTSRLQRLRRKEAAEKKE